MNRKGQALVEFVLILPIFIFLLFAIYDFGMIFSKENKLEGDVSSIVSLYKSGKTVDEIKIIYPNIAMDVTTDGDYTRLVFEDKVKLITPGFNRIFGNPYKIKVERYLPNEQ